MSFYEWFPAGAQNPTSAWFAANQFTVGGHTAYIGLQPKAPDAVGSAIFQAAFSVFGTGATTTDKQCWSGADGGSGVTCSLRFTLKYGDVYQLRVERVPSTLTSWKGTVIDLTSGQKYHIGSWTLLDSSGIKGSQYSFLERYLNGSKCGPLEIPYVRVLYGNPTGNYGAYKGVMSAATEGSPYCKGNQGFVTAPSAASPPLVYGTYVQAGFF